MSDPKEILERRLQAAVDDEETRGLHFFCQVGGRDLAAGMTTLQVSGSGWTLLGWRNGDRELYSVDLSWSDQKFLYELLLRYPFWDSSPARRDGEEDEINVHLRFCDRDAGTYSSLHFWDSEMQDYPELEGLMLRISELVQNISGGDIPALLADSFASNRQTSPRAP